MEYNLMKPWETLDKWQKDVLECNENICLRSGRQVGKTTIISIKAGEEAVHNRNYYILIGACVIEQAEHILRKTKEYIQEKYPSMIKKVTLHFIELTNSTIIQCKAIGDTGEGMRGPTANIVIIDEAAFVKERAWSAITPIISVSKGKMIVLSTPYGKKGYFYKCFEDENFKSFHVSARECPRHTKEFLDEAEKRMTKVEFATEYLGEFIDELRQYFTDELIEKCCILPKSDSLFIPNTQNFLGVDIARFGSGETTYEVLKVINKENIEQVENIVVPKGPTTDVEEKIKQLNDIYNLNRKSIGIDSAGVGGGVFDHLIKDDKVKRKVVSIENATRAVNREGKGKVTTIKRKTILKENLYTNLKGMMERGELKLLKQEDIIQSLMSIQCEYVNEKMRFWGTKDHIVEGLTRAAWLAKDKPLKIYIH